MFRVSNQSSVNFPRISYSATLFPEVPGIFSELTPASSGAVRARARNAHSHNVSVRARNARSFSRTTITGPAILAPSRPETRAQQCSLVYWSLASLRQSRTDQTRRDLTVSGKGESKLTLCFFLVLADAWAAIYFSFCFTSS